MKIVFVILIYTIMSAADAFKSNYSLALKEKILFGEPGKLYGKKFTAALVYNNEQYGAAFFITKNILLTAASRLEKFFTCDNVNFNDFWAYAGSHTLFQNGRRYFFEYVEVHKNYNFLTKLPHYDIGTIKLIIPRENKINIDLLTMPEAAIRASKVGQLSGWGPRKITHHSSSGAFQNILLTIGVIVVATNGEMCQSVADNKFEMDSSLLCAASLDVDISMPLEDKDTGTPITHLGKKALGILSYWDKSDTDIRKAAIYTNLFHYSVTGWITEAKKDLNERHSFPYSRIKKSNIQSSN